VQRRVVDHTLDVLSVHFDHKVLDADRIQLSVLQSAEETIKLELRLRITRLSIVKGDRSEAAGIALSIFTKLKEDVTDTIGARVDSENDRSFGFVVERTKGRRVQDSVFEGMERGHLRRSYLEGFVLAGELNERTSNQSIALDENAKNSTGTQKSANFRDVRRNWPVLDNLNTRRVGDPSVISADMSENLSLRNSDESFLATKRRTIGLNTLNQTIHSLEVFPDKTTNPRVLRNSLEGAVR
jgi:hypothetical protein